MIAGLKRKALFLFLIVAAAFAVYWPSLGNGFVWDDSALIQRDPFIRSWRLMPEGLRHFLFADATGSDFYRPVQRLTYTWDYQWGAFRPWIYHLDSILAHALAGVFLFLMAERLLRLLEREHSEGWALATALIWTIHPLWTSAVCYVSGRADPLAALFGFWGLWVLLGGRKEGALPGGVLFFLALCSKESGAIFMALALALLTMLRRPREEIVRWAVTFAIVIAAGLTLRLAAEHIPPPASKPLAWGARPIIALRAVAEYAGLYAAPRQLHMERDVLPFDKGDLRETVKLALNREFQTLAGALLAAVAAVWMAWSRKQERGVFCALVCMVVSYLPVSGLFALNASVAEHWLYVPGAFLTLALLLTLRTMPQHRVATAVVALWAAALAGRTWLRNGDWHDQRTFLEHTLADAGENARMLINLGGLELTEGNTDRAIADLKRAQQLSPDQPFGLLSLGAAYLRAKQYPLAQEQFERAAAFPHTAPEALQDLAVLAWQAHRVERTDLLRKAAQLAPGDWQIQRRYLTHLVEKGQNFAAITGLRAITTVDPWRADAWKMLGDLWSQLGQFDSASRAYRKAAELDVHDEIARRKTLDAEARVLRQATTR